MVAPPPSDDIERMISAALAEDVGEGDLTAALIPEGSRAGASVICRQSAVICGRAWFEAVFRRLDPAVAVGWSVEEGEAVAADTPLCSLAGAARALLTGERSALNFLQVLSATATRTRQYVQAVAGTQARILDTRKTLPGLRAAQKYAVRCGGGGGYRMGLFDAILVKENHIAASGSIAAAVASAHRRHAGVRVEVEAENLAEVREALAAGADIILLDDFDIESLREAVTLVRGGAKLEASGGVTLDNVRALAATGVDYISVGALTKDIAAVDLSMRITQPPM